MPRIHLRRDRRYCPAGILFRYENRSGWQHWSSQSLLPASLRSWPKFNFAGMPAVKLCDGSSCRRRMFSFVREVSQAVLSATLLIHRRHMRTRLKLQIDFVITRFLLALFAEQTDHEWGWHCINHKQLGRYLWSLSASDTIDWWRPTVGDRNVAINDKEVS